MSDIGDGSGRSRANDGSVHQSKDFADMHDTLRSGGGDSGSSFSFGQIDTAAIARSRKQDEERNARAAEAYSNAKSDAEEAFEEKNYPEALRLYNKVINGWIEGDDRFIDKDDPVKFYFERGIINRALNNHDNAVTDYREAIREGKTFDEAETTDLKNYFTKISLNFDKIYMEERKKYFVIQKIRKPWNVITRIVCFFFVAAVLLRMFVYADGTFPIYGIIISIAAGAFIGYIFPFILTQGSRNSTLFNRAVFKGIKIGGLIKVLMVIMLIIGGSFAWGSLNKVIDGNIVRALQKVQETATYNIGDSVTVFDYGVRVYRNSNFDDFVATFDKGDKLRIAGNKVVREYNGRNFNYWQIEQVQDGLRGLISARFIINSDDYATSAKGVKTEDLLFSIYDKLFPDPPPEVDYKTGNEVEVTRKTKFYDTEGTVLNTLVKGETLTITGKSADAPFSIYYWGFEYQGNEKYWTVEYDGTQGWIRADHIQPHE